MTEDEMAGWHHWLNGLESEWTPELVMDREAWRAAIHGVAKSRTRLSNWTELNWTVHGVAKELDMTEHYFYQTLILILVEFGELQQNTMGKAEPRCLECWGGSVVHVLRSLLAGCPQKPLWALSAQAQRVAVGNSVTGEDKNCLWLDSGESVRAFSLLMRVVRAILSHSDEPLLLRCPLAFC